MLLSLYVKPRYSSVHTESILDACRASVAVLFIQDIMVNKPEKEIVHDVLFVLLVFFVVVSLTFG